MMKLYYVIAGFIVCQDLVALLKMYGRCDISFFDYIVSQLALTAGVHTSLGKPFLLLYFFFHPHRYMLIIFTPLENPHSGVKAIKL